MTETPNGLKPGQDVPDFEMETFDSKARDFGKIGLAKLKADKKWLILFFYPADFTFV